MRALLKLKQVLPAHLRRRVAARGAATIAPPLADPTVDPQELTENGGLPRPGVYALTIEQEAQAA